MNHQDQEDIRLTLTPHEARLIVGALREVLFAVPGFEYQAKLGFTFEESRDLAKAISKKIAETGIDL